MKATALLPLAVFLAAVSATASDSPPPTIYVDECPGEESPAVGTAKVWIVLDNDTGQLRHATAKELAAMGIAPQEISRHSTEGLRMIVRKDGSHSVNLQGRFQSAMIVRIDGDNVTAACVDDDAQAAAFIGAEEK